MVRKPDRQANWDMLGAVATPVLLLVDRQDIGQNGLQKAMLLARYLQAPLELFLCEVSPGPRAGRDLSVPARAQEYLQALRQSIHCTDVDISTKAEVAGSVVEGLRAKLQRSAPVLVVVPTTARDGQEVSATDVTRPWASACGAPLLLARRRPWRPVPRFGAAVDLSATADAALGRRIVRLAETLTRRCGALLEYVFVAPGPVDAAQINRARQRLESFAGQRSSGWLYYRCGDPVEQLTRVVLERDPDVLLLGASDRVSRGGAGMGHGDVLLVPRAVA